MFATARRRVLTIGEAAQRVNLQPGIIRDLITEGRLESIEVVGSHHTHVREDGVDILREDADLMAQSREDPSTELE